MGERLYEIARSVKDAPHIPFPPNKDREKLKKSLGHVFPDGELVLATLPIGEVNVRSRNNNLYGRRAMEKLVSLVKSETPEGNWGHIKEEDMGTWYGPPDVKWLDAQIDPHGVVWGLALAMTRDTAAYFESADALNSKVGTSIFAQDVVRQGEEIIGFDRLRIDLADPTRVGVPITAAVPHVRKEMEDPSEDPQSEKEDPMSESKQTTPPVTPPAQPPAGSVVVPAETLVNESTERGRMRAQITELQQSIETLTANGQDIKALRTLLGLKPDDDVVSAVTELHRKHKEVAAEQAIMMQEYIDDRVEDAVGDVKDAKGMVLLMVKTKNPLTKAEAQQAVTSVLEMAEVKSMLKNKVVEQSGGKQSRPQEHQQDAPNKGAAIEQFLAAKPKGA